MDCTIVIHGGAGVISKDTEARPYFDSLSKIISESFIFASRTDTPIRALDVVEFAVRLLEDDPLFNAGRGAVLTAEGTHELEASIMDGSTLRCGAVSKVNTVKNPVSLARAVMERTKHNYLVGDAVLNKLANDANLERVEPSYYTTERRVAQLHLAIQKAGVFLDHSLPIAPPSVDQPGGTGTVGCVCMLNGEVAAATSTGGLTNKLCGRIGDTPISGAGNYAHHATGAFSGTGTGEDFMRHVATHDAHCRMLYGGALLPDAVHKTVNEVLPQDCGGIIAVDTIGNYTMPFNTLGMFRGVATSSGIRQVGIWEEMIDI